MHAAGNIPVQLSDLVGLVRLELDGNFLSGEAAGGGGGGGACKGFALGLVSLLRLPREGPAPSLIVILSFGGTPAAATGHLCIQCTRVVGNTPAWYHRKIAEYLSLFLSLLPSLVCSLVYYFATIKDIRSTMLAFCRSLFGVSVECPPPSLTENTLERCRGVST